MSDMPPPYEPPPSSPSPQSTPPPYQPYAPQPGYPGYPGSPFPAAPTGPYAPYPGGPYGTQGRSHTVRNVLLSVGVVLLVLCGGGTFGVISIVHKVKDAGNYAGNPDRPITVKPGQAFTIGDFDYAAGWKVTPSRYDDDVISGLSATNSDSSDSPSIQIKFLKGSTVLTEVTCFTTDIGKGQSKALTCYDSDETPFSGYDRITVNDSYKHYDY